MLTRTYRSSILTVETTTNKLPQSPPPLPWIPPDTPQAVPTGIPAPLIKKVPGWNDTIVAQLLGQISPSPPRPFVVPITDKHYKELIKSEIDCVHPGWGSNRDTVWVISVCVTNANHGSLSHLALRTGTG
ncbi:hypothetical protein PGT21_024864 [Puccinia graminis f. sp. tritici]|uniref:Uncharacterized protein n=1 Tax=Puccinia graminis f. sp. tritici TaxID=56615 RepID=A0A5B0P1B8_PUCGR|nr:hypothetical protein PGT21_024864 [Puccinia graminis f. sp. tritici]KAA1129029.1 hypothetical protein PGTUg99_024466 [Puccinia graminis f. sp. tritici]